MKLDTALWVVIVLAFVGVVWFGMKPKVCTDKTTGDSRATHRFFPCGANEIATTA